MQLHLLPQRSGSAAENMATDFLLLQRYPLGEHARFRHYGWHRPACTFGYSQPLEFVRTQLPTGDTIELCRRPTGGGVVDHRADWTYALVIPREHDLYEVPAPQSYQLVHQCLAEALLALGQPAMLQPLPNSPTAPVNPGVCFTRAEPHDVVHPQSGAKIAGAAQKRSKHGMLFQGSIARDAVQTGLDWDAFEHEFTTRLAGALCTPLTETPWPEFDEDEVSGLTEQYASPEWNERR